MRKVMIILVIVLQVNLVMGQKVYQTGVYGKGRLWKTIGTVKGVCIAKYINKEYYWLGIKGEKMEYRVNVVDTNFFKKINVNDTVSIPVHRVMWTNSWKVKAIK